jgi:hypothetical protein
MSFTFAPARRENVPVRLGIAGPSRSGKSYSALRVGLGLVGGDPKKVFAINTERDGITLYADKFKFMSCDLTPPFSPDRYLEIIRDAERAGAGCIIVDSFSHEWEGEGGVLEMVEAFLSEKAGNDFGKREKWSMAAWAKIKGVQHVRLINAIQRLNCHTIFCLRANSNLHL